MLPALAGGREVAISSKSSNVPDFNNISYNISYSSDTGSGGK